MSDDNTIPGTVLEDNAIHRASLWLEGVKFGERAGVTNTAEEITDDDWLWFAVIEECKLPVSVEQLKTAATHYGINMRAMTIGDRVNFAIPAPGGNGVMSADTIFISLWLDAFCHGAATAAAKYGLSRTEVESGVQAPES
jgi:hypothetical protein